MARICVVGSWHLASVSSVCLAHMGNRVCGVHDDARAIEALDSGRPPVHEPRLPAMLKRQLAARRLRYVSSYEDAVRGASFIMIALDTPVRDDDSPDMDSVWRAIRAVAKALVRPATVVINSQVPVGTCEEVQDFLAEQLPRLKCHVAYNPEFLQLGRAVELFLQPDRIVIGAKEEKVRRRVAGLYASLGRPIVMTDLRTAEMIKHASNAYLATSISFANEMANICDALGGDFSVVARAMRLDRRVGPHAYLSAGLGFGGGTLGRELRTLQDLGRSSGRQTPLIDAVVTVNTRQQGWVVEQLGSLLGNLKRRRIGVLGLTYKAGTDTLRRSQALETIRQLQANGAEVAAYDPLVKPDELAAFPPFDFSPDIYETARNCDALALITAGSDANAWDFARLASVVRRKVFFDARSILDPGNLLRHG